MVTVTVLGIQAGQGDHQVGQGQVGQEPVQDHRVEVVHSASEQFQARPFREVNSKTQKEQFFLNLSPRMQDIHRRVQKPTQKHQKIQPEVKVGQVKKSIKEERQISCLLLGEPPQQEVGGGQLRHKDRTTNLCYREKEYCASPTEIQMVKIVVLLAWVLARVQCGARWSTGSASTGPWGCFPINILRKSLESVIISLEMFPPFLKLMMKQQ